MFVTMSSHPKLSCTWVHYSVWFIVICLYSYSKFHNLEKVKLVRVKFAEIRTSDFHDCHNSDESRWGLS